MRYICVVLLLCSSLSQASDRWQFEHKIAVTGDVQAGVFHHLEGAGRKHIALSGQQLAVVWEDDSSADPQIYLAHKTLTDSAFSPPILLSSGEEAYEPAISALHDNGFIIVYEQDSAIYARRFSVDGLSKPLKLSNAQAGHASVATMNEKTMVVWREKQQRAYRLMVTQLELDKSGQLSRSKAHSIEAEPVEAPILMPTITVSGSSVSVAWEDRRAGHTRLLYSFSGIENIDFSKPLGLNEFFSNRNEYDKGNGVTRVAMAALGEDEVVAAWMDKRRGGNGYGIFSSLGFEGGASFGPNEKVHSEQGDKNRITIPQWLAMLKEILP